MYSDESPFNNKLVTIWLNDSCESLKGVFNFAVKEKSEFTEVTLPDLVEPSELVTFMLFYEIVCQLGYKCPSILDEVARRSKAK